MAQLATPHFGVLTYAESDVYYFPGGLPAFEALTRFVLVERPATAPIVFLQSIEDPELAFLTVPATRIAAGYRIPETAASGEGGELLPLAILTVRGSEVTANLRAPVLLDPATRTGFQAVPLDSPYSLRHPLPLPGGPPCS